MRRPVTTRLVAAVFLTAATSVAVPAGPASAAACSSADGVTVVVDFKGLGGGVQQACDASGGGQSAAALFTGNGFPLTYVQRQPGFVCRVSGVPADDPCVSTPPADAYWGLWWSDGESGSWTYASQGAGSLTIPDGGYVAFAWDGVSGSPPPGVAPAAHAAEPTPTPTPAPSSQPTAGPTRSPSSAGPAPTSSATQPGQAPSSSTSTSSSATTAAGAPNSPSTTKSTKPEKPDSSVPTSSVPESPSASDSAGLVASDPPGTDAGLPGWVALSLIGALFAAAGAAGLVRRRRGSTGP